MTILKDGVDSSESTPSLTKVIGCDSPLIRRSDDGNSLK